MISPQERVKQFKRVREIERTSFPDEPNEILSRKTIEAIIDVAVRQKTLEKEGWLENYVRKSCEAHLKNIKEGSALKAKNINLPKGERLRSDPLLNVKPRPLRAFSSSHLIRISFSESPDYQEFKEYYRVMTLLYDFECEIHIPKPEFEAFLKRTKDKASFEAELRGRIETETAKGFLLKASQLQVTSATKKRAIIPPAAKAGLASSPPL